MGHIEVLDEPERDEEPQPELPGGEIPGFRRDLPLALVRVLFRVVEEAVREDEAMWQASTGEAR